MFAGEFFRLVCQHGCVYEPALYCNPEENRSYKQNTTSSVKVREEEREAEKIRIEALAGKPG